MRMPGGGCKHSSCMCGGMCRNRIGRTVKFIGMESKKDKWRGGKRYREGWYCIKGYGTRRYDGWMRCYASGPREV